MDVKCVLKLALIVNETQFQLGKEGLFDQERCFSQEFSSYLKSGRFLGSGKEKKSLSLGIGLIPAV